MANEQSSYVEGPFDADGICAELERVGWSTWCDFARQFIEHRQVLGWEMSANPYTGEHTLTITLDHCIDHSVRLVVMCSVSGGVVGTIQFDKYKACVATEHYKRDFLDSFRNGFACLAELYVAYTTGRTPPLYLHGGN